MTRAEAINQLKINKQDYTYMMDDDAVDMAIKALEQEPCEDCVSRQALINAFPISDTYTLDDIIATIKFQPSVTPTRKKGKWIETKEGKYKCSNCKGEHSDPQTGKWHEVFDFKYPYCPNCGAEMESEE